jgi:hypothetical protein
MVRFIPKADGTFDYDFSIMDKYLDLAEKNMGKPKLVAFVAWELYLNTPPKEVKFSGNEDASNTTSAGKALGWRPDGSFAAKVPP